MSYPLQVQKISVLHTNFIGTFYKNFKAPCKWWGRVSVSTVTILSTSLALGIRWFTLKDKFGLKFLQNIRPFTLQCFWKIATLLECCNPFFKECEKIFDGNFPVAFELSRSEFNWLVTNLQIQVGCFLKRGLHICEISISEIVN